MSVTVANANIEVTAIGGDKALADVASSAIKWGKKAGAKFSAEFAVTMGRDLGKAKAQVESAKNAVEKASAGIEKAYQRQADAVGAARAAAARLNEIVERGAGASARAVAANEALERAHRKVLQSDLSLIQAEQRHAVTLDELTLAERRLSDEQKRADDQQRRRSSGFSIFGTVAGKAKSQMAGIGSELVAFGARFAAPVAAITAAGEAFKASFDTGVDFTKSLNTMKAVSDATGDDMAKVAAKARELGNDISLPATSANDAAAAMTELAKGGFDVQQSMDAAKGSLQLAAAAGVPAGQAAMIQSQLLHAFGLSATDAGRAADVLANAANQSSAEITDIAYGMQQAGTVAHGFKISMEDTATALAVLSNAGIQGSDAGTSLKTFLTSLTDQGKPAQNAIRELGLTVYDAQGRFTGLRTLFDQLTAASRRMTDEQFQAATATLFGTDAIRGSMVAASNGADGWDKMSQKIGQAGAAAKVAAAKTEGVPGALERMKNAAESLGLSFFDLIKVPVSAAFDGIAAGVSALEDVMNRAAGGVRGLFQSFKDSGNLDRLLSGLRRAWEFLKPGFDALTAGLRDIGGAIVGVEPKFKPLADSFGRLMTALKPVAEFVGGAVLLAIRGLVEGTGMALSALAPVVGGIAGVFVDGLTGLMGILTPVVDFVTSAFRMIGDIAMWLWRQIFVPAFEGIVAAAQLFWSGFQYVWSNVEAIIKVVGKVFEWLDKNVVSPALAAIGGYFNSLWTDYVQPVFDWVIGKFDEVSSAVGRFWTEHVSPLIADLKSGWQQLMKDAQPIFDFFDKLFKGVGNLASGLADGVKSAFQGLMEIVKVPVHWIGNFLSSVPVSLMGVDVPVLKDLHDFGVKLQGYASGGAVAGRTAGGVLYGPGDGTSDSIVGVDDRGAPTALVSAGEGIVKASAMDRGGSALVAALNAGWVPSPQFLRSMLPGFADGGAVGAEGLNPGADNLRSLIMRQWPQIKTIGGRRSEDGFGEHSSGNAIDVMIPGWNTAEGRALGDQIAAFLRANRAALGLNGFIWRQNSFGYGGSFDTGKPMSDRGSPTQNHFDHVHAILGAGRGSSAAPVGLPTSSITLPDGSSFSGGSGGSGTAGGLPSASAGSGASGASGGYIGAKSERGHQADQRSLQEAKDRVEDTQIQLDNAQRRLDELKRKEAEKGKVSQLQLDKAQQSIDRADREHDQAVQRLAEAQARVDAYDPAQSGKRGRAGTAGAGGEDAKSFAQGIGEGLLQVAGLGDSGLFSNPLDWPIVKLFTSFASWATGKGSGKGQQSGALGLLGAGSGGPGELGGDYSPADFTSGQAGGDPVAGVGSAALGVLGSVTGAAQPVGQADGRSGPYVDQSVTVNGNIGDSYNDVRNQVQRDQNLAARRYEGQLVRQ